MSACLPGDYCPVGFQAFYDCTIFLRHVVLHQIGAACGRDVGGLVKVLD